MNRRLGWMILVAFLVGGTLPLAARDLVESTVVIYNRVQPESRALAKLYAETRGIPFAQVLGLALPETEEISREEYITLIQNPIEKAFDENRWWIRKPSPQVGEVVQESLIRYLVLVRGVPLKVRRAADLPEPSIKSELPPDHTLQQLVSQNESSVDSDLAAFFDLRNEFPGIVPNPYFRRFSSIFDAPPSASPMLVGRLDGPDVGTVQQMIESAVAAEKRGLWGWAVIDARGIKSGPYLEGDKWLREAAALLRKQGIPVLMDDLDETLPDGFPMPPTAVYYGWYAGDVNGPFANPGFRFVPGAVAAHIHSFSAVTLRSLTSGWSGPLVARGAAVTVGNVYEPYLSLTTNLDVFQDRLHSGFTAGEAAYMATLGLSWMNVVLGDPLYRPYASWSDIPKDPDPTDAPFVAYRKAVLTARGNPVAAAPALRQLARSTGNSMFLEALAEAQFAAGDARAANESLGAALNLETRESVRFRLTWQKITFLLRKDDKLGAMRLLSEALGDFRDPAHRKILDAITLKLQPPPVPAP